MRRATYLTSSIITYLIWSVFVVLIFVYTDTYSQTHDIQWATKVGGMNTDEIFGICTDDAGNVYTSGGFQTTATFGSTTLTSTWSRDVHLSKQDAAGNYLWTIQGESPGTARGLDIAVDASGNIYLTGYFENSITFGSQTLTKGNNLYIYIAKFNNSGVCQWIEAIEGSTEAVWSRGIALDDNNNIYVTGELEGSGTFGTITTPDVGSGDIFLTKLNNSGTFLWAKTMGSSANSDVSYNVDLDANNNVLITGEFKGTAIIAGQSLTSTSSSFSDIFIAKFDSNGNGLWASNYGDSYGSESGRGVIVDSNDDIYVTGFYKGTINFGANSISSVTDMYTTSPGYDMFVAKFNSAGTNIWAETAGEGRDEYPMAIDIDASNNVYITGYTEGDMIFDLGETSEYRLFNTNDQSWSAYEDVFVSCYKADGNFVWAKGGGDGYSDRAYGIAVDNSQNVYVGGRVYDTGSASFDGMAPTGPASTDVDDALVIKYKAQTTILYTKIDINCFGNSNGAIDITPNFGAGPYTYSWTGPNGFTSGNEDISGVEAGTFYVQITDGSSTTVIDSIIIITPTQVVASPGNIWNASDCNTADGSAHVIGNGGTLIAGPAPYIYTWSDSQDNSQLVDFLLPGVHSVTITDANGCSDSSSMVVGPTTNGGSISGGSTICENTSLGTLAIIGNSGDVIKWQVSFDSGAWTDIANTTLTHTEILINPGTYNYRAIVQCGNNLVDTSLSATVIVEICSSIDQSNVNNISIYPNPSNGIVNINGTNILIVELIDINGRTIIYKEPSSKINILDLGNNKGVYILKITTPTEVIVKRLIIK